MVSTFQLSGRRAALDMATIKSSSSSVKPCMQPSVTYSRVVPSCSATTEHSATTSSLLAKREATGAPSPSLWVYDSEVEKPKPPARMPSANTARIASSWPGSASLPVASAPMTARRMAQWPTRNPAFTPRVPSNRSRYSPKVRHDQSRPDSRAASGMPSTLAIMRWR